MTDAAAPPDPPDYGPPTAVSPPLVSPSTLEADGETVPAVLVQFPKKCAVLMPLTVARTFVLDLQDAIDAAAPVHFAPAAQRVDGEPSP